MILPKEVLQAVLPAAAPDRADRYFLQSVCVEPDGTTVATNGDILIRARATWAPDDTDFPQGQRPAFVQPTTRTILPTAIVQKLIAAMAKKKTIPILQTVQLSDREGTTYATATDLDTALDVEIKPDESATFPDYARVIPADDRPIVRVALTVANLSKLIQTAKATAGNRSKDAAVVVFHVPTEAPHRSTDGDVVSAITVTFPSARDVDVTVDGVVMPCRI